MEKKVALFNALAWMEGMKDQSDVKAENIDVGIQCLTEAFDVNLQDAEQKRTYAVNGSKSFEEIFAAGLKALSLEVGTPHATATDDFIDQDPVVLKNPDLWKKWVAKLEDKGFFNGTPAGTEGHLARMKKALAKFKEKFGDLKSAPPALTKAEKEAKAEDLKVKGNAALNGGNHQLAADYYTEAINMSPDGPSSHIYYANLAAALMYLGKYSEVIDECEKAIALKPSYVKAYSRMGNAQIQLKDFQGAIDSFRRGLEVDSTNAACKEGLAEAERKLRQPQAASSSRAPVSSGSGAGAGGMPDLSGLASMLGGGGDGLANLMNNPALQQMASSMMQNPAMMQMAQNMMQNPEMLSSMMSNLGGMGGGGSESAPPASGGGGGMPDISQLMNSPELAAARSDPDLQDFFRDVDTQGPSAAMRHMSNPKVSQLIQNMMSRMQ